MGYFASLEIDVVDMLREGRSVWSIAQELNLPIESVQAVADYADYDEDYDREDADTVTGCDPEEYYLDDDGQPDEAQEWADFDPDC
jgi:hypothetical protein